MVRILFVCTGNMFRSLSAEYAFRDFILKNRDSLYELCGFRFDEIKVSSAGISVRAQMLHEGVVDEMRIRDINVINNMYMQIDKRLVDESDLIVAMGEDHKKYLRKHFQVDAILFNEVCFGRSEGIRDDWEVFGKNHDVNMPEEDKYIREVVNYIFDAMPDFAKNFKNFIL